MKRIIICIFLVMAVYLYLWQNVLYSQQAVEYYVVNDDMVNLREEPDVNSKVIEYESRNKIVKEQLRITDVVRKIKIDEKEIKIGNKLGRWMYVDTGRWYPKRREFIKGWVFDYYLSGIKDFAPVKSLKYNMRLQWADGDAGFKYEFYKNGKCKIQNTNEVGTLYIDKIRRIVVPVFYSNKKYSIQKYLWATIKSQNTFFIDSEGRICIASGEPPSYTTCAKIIK